MRRSVVLSMKWVRQLIPLAQRAEAAGLYRVWTTEYNTYDAMIRSALIAASTERIQIGTGITYAFSRRPVALAAAAADIQVASEGRFTLGLGMGTNGMRSKWYDVHLNSPARRFAETVKLLREAQAATDGLHFNGDYENVDVPGYALDEPELTRRMEIWGSGVNAAMLASAARSCDGVATHPLTVAPGYWQEAVEPALAKGLHEDGSRAKVAAWILTSVQDDEEQARRQSRRNLAFYFSTPSYQSAAQGATWAPAAERVLGTAREKGTNDLEAIADLIPDDMSTTSRSAAPPTRCATGSPGWRVISPQGGWKRSSSSWPLAVRIVRRRSAAARPSLTARRGTQPMLDESIHNLTG